jgi:hypothetical protein
MGYNILFIRTNNRLGYIILAIQAPRQQHAMAQQKPNLASVPTMASTDAQSFSLFFQH